MKLIRFSYYFFYFAPETRNKQCLRQQLQAEHTSGLCTKNALNLKFEISPFQGQSKWLKEKVEFMGQFLDEQLVTCIRITTKLVSEKY